MQANGVIEIEVCERSLEIRTVPKFEGDRYCGLVRTARFHAQLKDQPNVCATGPDCDAAVVNLVRKHPEVFKLLVTYLGVRPR